MTVNEQIAAHNSAITARLSSIDSPTEVKMNSTSSLLVIAAIAAAVLLLRR